ncbi:hypothetical protein DAMA08_052040 [Martiniozyma asiatica (nom. inval.)]|nr:hypothetical protein DAMA08_052040 [Martiniozyma asiatica]
MSKDLELERENILEDILPSFAMHNHMFNRTIFDEPETGNIKLPNYDEISINPCESSFANSNSLDPSESVLNEYERLDRLSNFGMIDPINNPDKLILNNLEVCRTLSTPIEIKVVLTKGTPAIGVAPEIEDPLRQFTYGDIINGYLLIKNKTSKPIPFEMCLVSLKSSITITNIERPSELINAGTILNAYDLSASFHEQSNKSKRQSFSSLEFDNMDQTYIGFTQEKKIYPFITHKKFFTFKVPHVLLDTACPYQIKDHLLIPPSFGLCGKKNEFEEITDVKNSAPASPKPGLPILTEDFATPGQSISYYVNVQLIGHSTEVSKIKMKSSSLKLNSLVSKKEKIKEDEYVHLKNVHHHILIDTAGQSMLNPFSEYDSKSTCSSSHEIKISTKKQFCNINKIIEEEIDVLKEIKNLIAIGITDKSQQSEIIYRNIGETKKYKNTYIGITDVELASNYNNNTRSNIINLGENSSLLKQEKIISLNKDFFNSVDGRLNVILSMESDCSASAMSPPRLNRTKNFGKRAKSKASLRTNSSGSIFSLNSNNTHGVSSFSSATSYSPTNPHLNVKLEFKPTDYKHGTIPNLPTHLTIIPKLHAINYQSQSSLPVTFDNDFIFSGGLEESNLHHMRKKYLFYKQQLVDLAKQIGANVQKPELTMSYALGTLRVQKVEIDNVFQPINLKLKGSEASWKYDSDLNLFTFEQKLPLILENKHNYNIIPTFQSCQLGRLYGITFDTSIKKQKTQLKFEFPLTIS